MKKYNAVCWLIFCVIAASCSYSTIVPTNNWDAARITQSSLPSPNHSFGPRWEMVDQSIYIGENLSIVVYAIKLTGQSTVVFSSVVSDEDRLNQPDFSIMLQDNVGDANLMSKKIFIRLVTFVFGS